MLEFENMYKEQGYKAVCGVDEAGRGPLAGPVYAAAVIFPEDLVIDGINDSKKLSEKKREELFIAYSIASATVEEIEKINILQASLLAMKRAVESLSVPADFVMVDGNKLPDLSVPCEAIVKGDARSQSIAAASILAKVSRDRVMKEYAKKYPLYGFEKHKGYASEVHRNAIMEYGPCEIHRMSFLKNVLAEKAERDAEKNG